MRDQKELFWRCALLPTRLESGGSINRSRYPQNGMAIKIETKAYMEPRSDASI